MKSVEEYYNEIKKNAFDQWKREGYVAFKNMEYDPVINLLLLAMSYQGFNIQNNIEQFEEKKLRDFHDRIIPFYLIKPAPAFSMMKTALIKSSGEAITDKIIDETCVFEFEKKPKKIKFAPLFHTKIINAELQVTGQQGNVIRISLNPTHPTVNIENLSGLSFYIETVEPVDIQSIRYNGYEFPLIKPSQYNELPFTKWFNNDHLFLNQNYFLFGSYDYWQEIFLTNGTQLYYIDQYKTSEIPLNGQTAIELEIILDSYADISDQIKINCFPVVNVEKKEAVLTDRYPVHDLSSEAGEFLNLLYNKEEKNLDEYIDSFIIRQHGVERYNRKQLLKQMQDMLSRYDYDYYAFQSINELKNGDKIKRMQEVIDEILYIVNKTEKDDVRKSYYAILKRNSDEIKNIHLDYLISTGATANGIVKNMKATKNPTCFDRNQTVLLCETKGGRNCIQDETQKENIAKYYFQTQNRLITPADIQTFIKTFYYKDIKLGDEIEHLTIKPELETENKWIAITIKLKNDSSLKNPDKIESLITTLQSKITLRSTGILPFQVNIY